MGLLHHDTARHVHPRESQCDCLMGCSSPIIAPDPQQALMSRDTKVVAGLGSELRSEPTVHAMAISIVIPAEPHSQGVFLWTNLNMLYERYEEQRSHKWTQRAQPDGPTEEHKRQAEIHGIARPGVHAGSDERSRRVRLVGIDCCVRPTELNERRDWCYRRDRHQAPSQATPGFSNDS